MGILVYSSHTAWDEEVSPVLDIYIQYHLLHFIIIALSSLHNMGIWGVDICGQDRGLVARELLAATSGFTVAVYLY